MWEYGIALMMPRVVFVSSLGKLSKKPHLFTPRARGSHLFWTDEAAPIAQDTRMFPY